MYLELQELFRLLNATRAVDTCSQWQALTSPVLTRFEFVIASQWVLYPCSIWRVSMVCGAPDRGIWAVHVIPAHLSHVQQAQAMQTPDLVSCRAAPGVRGRGGSRGDDHRGTHPTAAYQQPLRGPD